MQSDDLAQFTIISKMTLEKDTFQRIVRLIKPNLVHKQKLTVSNHESFEVIE